MDGVKCIGEIDFGDLQMDNLEALTLTRANLTSLKNFPTLPSLVKVGYSFSPDKYIDILFVSWISAPTGCPKALKT